jgi:hypothetical protein
MSINEDTVRRLMEAANNAMTEEAELLDATGNEVASAVFTLAKTVVQAGISLGADPADLRRAVEQLLLECAPPRLN